MKSITFSLGARATTLILKHPQTVPSLAGPATARQVAATFKGARQARVEELLDTLASLGQVREVEEDKYAGQ